MLRLLTSGLLRRQRAVMGLENLQQELEQLTIWHLNFILVFHMMANKTIFLQQESFFS
jgi:hypothetical protein